MIRFKSLEVKDFGVLEAAEVELADQGLVLIRGQNRDTDAADSNGSGKTTLFKALTWALYDQFVGEGSPTDVTRRGAKKATVKVIFEDDDHEYTVIRSRTGSGATLQLLTDGVSTTGRTAADTQVTIEDKLGLDWDAFRNTVLYGQGDIKRFADPATTDAERKSVLKRILRLDMVDKALELVRSDLKLARASLEEANVQRRIAERVKGEAQTALNEVEQAGRLWERAHDARVSEAAALVARVEGEADALRTAAANVGRLEALEVQIQSELDKLPALAEARRAIEARQTALDTERAGVTARRKVVEGERAAQQAADKDAVRLARVAADDARRATEARRDAAQGVVQTAERAVAEARSAHTAHMERVRAARKEALQKREAIDRIKALDICPTCFTPVGDSEHAQAHIAEMEAEHAALLEAQQTAEEELERLRVAHEEAKAAWEAAKLPLAPIAKELADNVKGKAAEALERELAAKRQTFEERITAIDGELAAIDKRRSAITRELMENDQQVDDVEEYRPKLKLVKDKLIVAREASTNLKVKEQALKGARSALEAVEGEVNPHSALVEAAQQRVDSEGEVVKAALGAVAKAEAVLPPLLFWERAFSNAGLPAMVMDSVMPVITEAANTYLGILADGDITVDMSTQKALKGGTTREAIDIRSTIEGNEGVPPSGGQRCKISLAVDLALMDMVAGREGAQVDILMLDEILDGLDEEGRARVVDLLRYLRSIRSSVFVVSHDSGIQEHFERSLTVVKEGGSSTVEAA